MASILDGIPISFYGIQRSTTKSVEGCTKREEGRVDRETRVVEGGEWREVCTFNSVRNELVNI